MFFKDSSRVFLLRSATSVSVSKRVSSVTQEDSMKPTTGYVYYDKSRKKWVARVSYTDEATGKRQSVRRWHPLKSDAIEALPGLLATLKTHGARPLKGELLTVADVIKAYEDEHVKPAEIHDGRKVAGLKSWTSVKF
jgi:hypothetical protein